MTAGAKSNTFTSTLAAPQTIKQSTALKLQEQKEAQAASTSDKSFLTYSAYGENLQQSVMLLLNKRNVNLVSDSDQSKGKRLFIQGNMPELVVEVQQSEEGEPIEVIKRDNPFRKPIMQLKGVCLVSMAIKRTNYLEGRIRHQQVLKSMKSNFVAIEEIKNKYVQLKDFKKVSCFSL